MTGSSSWITRERRLAIYLRDAFVCQYCGRDLAAAKPAEMGLDHLENYAGGDAMITTKVRYRCGHTIRYETEKIHVSCSRVVRELETLLCPDCSPRNHVDAAHARTHDHQAIEHGWGSHEQH